MMRKTQRRLLSAVVAIVFTGIFGTGINAVEPVHYWSSTNQQPPYWESNPRAII